MLRVLWGMASTVLVAGLLGTACWIAGGSWGTPGTVMFDWRVVELGFCSLCLGLMKSLVSSEALSSCWNLNHVGVGFSAFLTHHSFFTFPRIRILEPYILSCLEWHCFNSILEVFGISIGTCLLSLL